jgi:hypothetical protein
MEQVIASAILGNAMIDRLEGDPEPFASLFAAEAEWRGVSRGVLWWRHAPS